MLIPRCSLALRARSRFNILDSCRIIVVHLQQQQQRGSGHPSQVPPMPPLPPGQPPMQRPPPLPAAAVAGQSTSSSSSAAPAAPPTRSIFDIEKSPFSGAGIEKLLAPIMSPANLSDVSDLANDNGNALIAESAAEVPLEPGEIFDTPTSAGGANSIFNFPPSAAPAKSASSKRCDDDLDHTEGSRGVQRGPSAVSLSNLVPNCHAGSQSESEAAVYRTVFDIIIAKLNKK